MLSQCPDSLEINFIVFHCQDGYRVGMSLEDLKGSDVLLADRIEGKPLTIVHGAPFRLIAPAHYGYKSAKHICKMECLSSTKSIARRSQIHESPAGACDL